MKNIYPLSALVLSLSFSSIALAEDKVDENYEEQVVSDPFKFINKPIYEINQAVDKAVLAPIARTYKEIVPDPIKTGVGNFFQNLKEPVNVVNYSLQGNGQLAAKSTARFLVNSTIGIAGLIDMASSDPNLRRSNTDFGQTMGVWGIGAGPYIVLPLLGSSSLRDATGLILVDSKIMPQGYIDPIRTRNQLIATEIIDTREEILKYEKILDDVIFSDKYETTKNAYLQRRQYLIEDLKN
jgi:phospholipid-binding lipoprotein MlaA